MEPQVVHRFVDEPIVVRGEPALDQAPVADVEPRRRPGKPPPRQRRKLVRVRLARRDGLDRRLQQRLPDRPLFVPRVIDSGQERQGEILQVRPDRLVRKQTTQFPDVPARVRVAQIRQHLPDLRAAEQMLLRFLEERRQRLRPPDEHAREAVVEETLVTESAATPGEDDHAFRRQPLHVRGREFIQPFPGNRKLLLGRHRIAQGGDDLHPLIRQWRDPFLDQPPFFVPVLVEEVLRRPERGRARGVEARFQKQRQVLRKP